LGLADPSDLAGLVDLVEAARYAFPDELDLADVAAVHRLGELAHGGGLDQLLALARSVLGVAAEDEVTPARVRTVVAAAGSREGELSLPRLRRVLDADVMPDLDDALRTDLQALVGAPLTPAALHALGRQIGAPHTDGRVNLTKLVAVVAQAQQIP